MTRSEAADVIEIYEKDIAICSDRYKQAIKMAVNSLRKESTISLDTFNQVCWERDIAILQLNKLGYKLGDKIN